MVHKKKLKKKVEQRMSTDNDSDVVSHESRTMTSKRSSKGSIGSYKTHRSSFHKTMTMDERQMMHPLEREDPIAYKFIQFVRLGYLEKEYQSTYGGLDMTMRFEWLKCQDAENSTWIGGFDWEC